MNWLYRFFFIFLIKISFFCFSENASNFIDVVIPCAEKDLVTIDLCIEGIKKNGKNVRRVIVVSSHPLTNKAEWFDEKKYPFTPFDLALEIFGNETTARHFLSQSSRIFWIYQQFLKLYAFLVIPDLSSNILILDADTIFLNPVTFIWENGEALYNVDFSHHEPYFVHAAKLIPGFKKFHPNYSGICHHMLFQKEFLNELFHTIEETHKTEPWKAICHCIDQKWVYASSMSEYEIYFHFIFSRTNQVKIRMLRWENISDLKKLSHYKQAGYIYVSCHSYLRIE